MNGLEFRHRGREMVDYLVDYLDNIDARRVTPNIEPGYLKDLIPTYPPDQPEDWDTIMDDVEKKIMIGVTHWQHPRFHAYFPAGNSYPSILGDMLGDAIGCIGFSWAASPACTELETIMLDWMGKMIGLPNQFLTNEEGSKGGGVIQTCASECVLDSLLAARTQAIRHLRCKLGDDVEETTLLSKLMAYCSKEAHSCVEKAAMIGFVKMRILEPDETCSLRGHTVREAMEADMENGLYPFFVSATLGTTGCCSFDNLTEIGPVCQEFGVWLHVDAAYAGNSFICPENRYLMKGIEYAMSFNTNPNKWMLVNFDCSLMWVRDRFKLTQALVVDPLYLQHSYSDSAIDYRHWGIPLSRRFRSLKLWFVIRSYGITGLQAYIREHCRLAKVFETYCLQDNRFVVCNDVKLALVCFRLKGSDELNQKLLSTINASGKLHMVPASVNEQFVIRFCVVAQHATDDDIEYAWKTIAKIATDVIEKMEMLTEDIKQTKVTQKDISPVNDDDAFKEEKEDVFKEKLEAKSKKSLAYKRSFFVRMVSDPKLYNPKIVPTKSCDVTSLEDQNMKGSSSIGGQHNINIEGVKIYDDLQPPSPTMKNSWISWPLAFILRNAGGSAREVETVSMRFRNWNTRLTLSPNGNQSQSSSRLPSPNYTAFKRFDEEKDETKGILVNGETAPSNKQPEDVDDKCNNDHLESKIVVKDNITRSRSSPYQEVKNQNQLNVGNPAEFKNGEDSNGSAFEKNKKDMNCDSRKLINGINEKKDDKETSIPSLPTRGILKRAKLANTKNEDKNGI